MGKIALLCVAIGLLLLSLGGVARAQTPVPPSPAVIVVIATPGAPPAPHDFWEENSKAIATGLFGLIFGGILIWLLKPIFEGLGRALVARLSKLGSGWGFKGRYLTHLIEEYRALNVRGRRTRSLVAVDLEQVYVSLHARLPEATLGRQAPTPLDVGQALGQHKRLAILGGPGTGKTTLLFYLTLTYARDRAGERLGLKERRLPILLPLRQLKGVLADEGTTTLPVYLTRWYTDIGLAPGGDFFEKELRDGRCLVLLDGLDEVADEAERRAMSEWVDRLVTIYPRNRYIVTSRPPGYESAPLEHGFTVLQVRDFTAQEIRQFARNWCLAVELADQGEDNPTARRRAGEAASDLVAAIEASAAIRKLAVNPLLLSIIALVHRYRATLPKRRVDLYAECVDVLLGHWDTTKGLVGRLSPGEKRAVLQPLALKMHLENRRDIGRRELEAQVARLLPAVSAEATAAADFVDEVRDRSGLLTEEGLGTYAFSHQTFQEYLCAREIVDLGDQPLGSAPERLAMPSQDGRARGLLLARLGQEWWQEVTLFYVGMADAAPVVDALLGNGEDANHSRLLLAGRCVAEAVRVPEAARGRVLGLLQEAFATCTGEQLLETGKLLADIAGEDSVDFFLRLARDDAERRAAALWSVGQIGRQPDEALPERVVERLLTRFQGEDLRPQAGAALMEVWGAQIADELQKRQLPLSLMAELLDSLLVTVPSGEFLMGDAKRPMHVGAFHIDTYPVTNAQYKRFVDATGHEAPQHWQGSAYLPEKALHPVVYVNWHDAVAYAQWAGKRLPTEGEWEKAARGTDGRTYPWGDKAPTPELCNFDNYVGDTTPVGQYSPRGDSPYGCADMAGNVWEWMASEEGESKVLRGGSWIDFDDNVRSAIRSRTLPLIQSLDLGFRCMGGSTHLPDRPETAASSRGCGRCHREIG